MCSELFLFLCLARMAILLFKSKVRLLPSCYTCSFCSRTWRTLSRLRAIVPIRQSAETRRAVSSCVHATSCPIACLVSHEEQLVCGLPWIVEFCGRLCGGLGVCYDFPLLRLAWTPFDSRRAGQTQPEGCKLVGAFLARHLEVARSISNLRSQDCRRFVGEKICSRCILRIPSEAA